MQPPSADLRSLVYDNPQYLKLSGVSDIRIPTLFETDTANDQDNLSAESSVSEVEAILDHLPQLNFLKEVPTDGRVITALAKLAFPEYGQEGMRALIDPYLDTKKKQLIS